MGLFALPALAQAQTPVTATVDRSSLSTDEALVLTVTIDSSAGRASQPTLPVMDGFQVVSSGSSTQISIVNGNMTRSAVELAKEWRTDRVLRRLEALLAVADKEHALIISGTGDVIEPDDNIVAIGSGGNYARASAVALIKHSDLTSKEIVEESLKIASNICIYTNNQIIVEELN